MKGFKPRSVWLGLWLALSQAPGLGFAQVATTEQLPLPEGTSPATAVSSDKRWSATFDTELRFTSSTERGNAVGSTKTRQVYAPLGFAITGAPSDDVKIELGVRSGYLDIRQSTPTASLQARGFTDTSVSATATYLGFNGIQPYVSLSANLPTGKTSGVASGTLDQDILQSEGLNIGPTIGINVPIGQNMIAAFGLGYTARGRFHRPGLPDAAGVQQVQTIVPGDVVTLNSALGYQEGRFSVQSNVAYSFERPTRAGFPPLFPDIVPFYQTGNRVIASLALGYALTDALSTKVTATFQHIDRNKLQNGLLVGLFREMFDSNPNTVMVMFDTTYKMGALSLGPSLSLMLRDRNGYDPSSVIFLSGRRAFSAGGTAQYAFNDKVSFNLRATHTWSDTDPSPIKVNALGPIVGSATPGLTSQAWTVSLGGTLKF